MRRIGFIFITLFLITAVKAEEYYCWAISGLNIRETPSPTGIIIGKLQYGQRVDIDWKSQFDYEHYEDLFLIGIKEDKSADVKFTGVWARIAIDGKAGYVFSGYLSRYPHFEIEKKDEYYLSESFQSYMSRNYRLLNYDLAIWNSNIYDNQVRSYSWGQGITFINDHNEKGASINIIFADMTFNEALLFIKFNFRLLTDRNPGERDNLDPSRDYFGISFSFEKCEINFPAPEGRITILQLGHSIVISYFGHC